eukprot:TRINITY_DN5131_c0_g1_i1.p1 TRINITY_DN5131_c0_g1~~TRINITY_DN5131_c0_g1_i1.p1  ORF type:complete len:303 (+),score=49.36 TRINITY_DN5131_c0_g1_i1:147-1055(+)
MRRSNREKRVRLDPLYDLAELPAIFLPDSETHTAQLQNPLAKSDPNKNQPNTTKLLKTFKGDYMSTKMSETSESNFKSSSLKGKNLLEAVRPARMCKGHSSRLSGVSDLSRRYEESLKKCKDLMSRKTCENFILRLKLIHKELPKRKEVIYKQPKAVASVIKKKSFSMHVPIKSSNEPPTHTKKANIDNKSYQLKMMLAKVFSQLSSHKRKHTQHSILSNNSCYSKNPYNFYGMRFHRSPRFFIWRHHELPLLRAEGSGQGDVKGLKGKEDMRLESGRVNVSALVSQRDLASPDRGNGARQE